MISKYTRGLTGFKTFIKKPPATLGKLPLIFSLSYIHTEALRDYGSKPWDTGEQMGSSGNQDIYKVVISTLHLAAFSSP